jgi:hypothetical protein
LQRQVTINYYLRQIHQKKLTKSPVKNAGYNQDIINTTYSLLNWCIILLIVYFL